jgi:tetratricopeptide (TPR) repeat protein
MNTSTQSPSGKEIRLAQILDDYLAAVQHGAAFDPSALLAAHPDLAEDLKVCLASLNFLRTASSADRLVSDFGEEGSTSAVLGDFRIVRELGRGGMGVVYEAHQHSLNRRVALKVLLAGRFAPADDLRRFRTEAEAAAQLDHPNIVPIHEVGEHAGLPFFSMALLGGGSLADRIFGPGSCDPSSTIGARPSPITPPEAARLVATIARAVHHAHQRGILHRDLKPSNILLDADGEPHITDFGLARRVAVDSSLTHSGDLLGSPAYMAPEQAAGEKRAVTIATDVYGLGAILYTVLTGKPPFSGESVLETVALVQETPPTPPSRIVPKLNRDLETVCLKCLEKAPHQRYASAEALADDLERWLRGESIAAAPPSRWHRFRGYARRHRVILTTTTLVTLALIAGTSVSVWQAVVARRARTDAVTQLDRARNAEAGALVQRDEARQAVDDMYSEVAMRWMEQRAALEPIQQRFLQKALDYYQRFAGEKSTDPKGRFKTAQAYHRLAGIQEKLGRHSEAEASYRRAVGMLQDLVAGQPLAVEYRGELAGSQTDLGDLLKQLGRTDEGAVLIRAGIALFEKLAVEMPSAPGYHAGLATAQDGLGRLLRDTGYPVEAEQSYRAAIAAWRKLTAGEASAADYRSGLAMSQGNLGNALADRDRLTDAEEAYRQSIALGDKLAADFPFTSEYRDDLANRYQGLAMLLFRAKHYGKAEQALLRAIKLYEKLAADSPSVPEYRGQLAKSYNHLGGIRMADNPAEAIGEFRRAIEVYSKLAADFPAVPGYQCDLAMAQGNLCTNLMKTGHQAEAQQLCRQSITLVEKLVAKSPAETRYANDLALHYASLGNELIATGDRVEAEQALQRAIALHEKLVLAAPDVLEFQSELAWTYTVLGTLLTKSGRPPEAESALRRAIAIFEKAVSESPSVPDYQSGLASASSHLAILLQSAGRVSESDFAQAMASAEKLAEAEAQNDLAWTLSTRLDHKHRPGDLQLALRLAKRAVEQEPRTGAFWYTLGVAEHRAGAWDKAIEALSRSMELTSGGSAGDWLFLAMAHAKKRDIKKARSWYDKGVAWMDRNQSKDEESIRIRAEATVLLQLEELDTRMPNGVAAFARGLADRKEETAP